MTNTTETHSSGPVVWALGVNTTIFVAKAGIGFLTGSAAMLSEAAHSLVDSSTELILLGGVWHSKRWSKAQFFWALVASVNMFVIGGLYAIYEGIRSVFGDEVSNSLNGIGILVLAISFCLEATSWWNAYKALNEERVSRGIGWVELLRTTTNVNAKTVLSEDTADMIGCVLGSIGLSLTMATGSGVWDGLAGLLIGVLLTGMAYVLGSQNLRLLTA